MRCHMPAQWRCAQCPCWRPGATARRRAKMPAVRPHFVRPRCAACLPSSGSVLDEHAHRGPDCDISHLSILMRAQPQHGALITREDVCERRVHCNRVHLQAGRRMKTAQQVGRQLGMHGTSSRDVARRPC